MEELPELRERVRGLTLEILNVVKKRMNIIEEIGRRKGELGLPIEDLLVERELRSLVANESKRLGLDEGLSQRLLSLLLRESIRVQKAKTGPAASSRFSKLLSLAAEKERGGEKVIHLEIGEPDFKPPGEVVEELFRAAKDGRTRYTDPQGLPELRRKIAEKLREDYGKNLKITGDNVLVTPGGRFAIYLALEDLVGTGDEVIGVEPLWSHYRRNVEDLGGRFVPVLTSLDEGWVPKVEGILERVSRSTKAVIVNYPNNPTGKIADGKVLREIAEICGEKDIALISDEVYSSYSFKPYQSAITIGKCRRILVSSFSKSHAMTGFRLGYVVSDKETIERLSYLQRMAMTSVSEFIQWAGVKALECREEERKNAKTIKSRAEFVGKRLREVPLKFYQPDGGLYFFPEVDVKGFDSEDFCSKLLAKDSVALLPGTAFGDYRKNFRISLCQPEEVLGEAIERIGRWVS